MLAKSKIEKKTKGKIPRLCVLGLILTALAAMVINSFNLSVSAGTSNVVFNENFEGAFPGSWQVFDGNPDAGEDYWGVSSWRSHGGSKSVWCSQVGDHSVRGVPNRDAHLYDNNMVAFLTRGDFDATKWDMAWLSFYAWIDTESSNDWVQLGSTGTGEPPVSVLWLKSGTYNSWSKYDVRIPEDSLKSRLRLDFVFASDPSAYREGVYIDDVVLTWYDITLDNYEVTPQKVSPGQTINFRYYINNPSSYTVNVGLGVSIKDPYGNTINDPSNDKAVLLPPGYSWQTRPFVIPSSASKGVYDVLFGIYADLIPGGGFLREWDFKTANDLLTVTQYKLAIQSSPSPHDSPNPSYGEHWYDVGDRVTATVDSPADEMEGTRYRCSGWSGTGSVPPSGTGTSVAFTINEDSSLTWKWVTQYKLTVNSAHGSPNPPVGEHWYDKGVQVTASVNNLADETEGTRYKNTGWTGSGSVPASGTSNSVTFYMNAPSSITWNWIAQYKLTVESTYGSSSGTGWYDEATYAFASISPTTVTSGEGTRYVFTGWSGDASGTSATSDRIHMDRPKTAIANWKTQYYLKISTEPSNLPLPTASPSGPWYDSDTTVTLTAQTVSGYEFEGWLVDGSQQNNNPIFLTMDKQHSVTAKYSVKSSLSPSSILCLVSPTTIALNSSVEVKGSISPAHGGVEVTLLYTRPNESVIERTVFTDTLGKYVDTFQPDMPGSWSVEASWAGDSDHEPARSNQALFNVIETPHDTIIKKTKVTLTLSVDREKISAGEKIEVSGRLSPSISNASIVVEFFTPNAIETLETATDVNGYFTATLQANETGLWRIRARFFGDAEHEEAEGEATFLVEAQYKKDTSVEQPSGLGLSEVLNIVLAIVVVIFLIILVKGGKKKMPKLLSIALMPSAQTDYLTRLRTEIAKLTAELALLGFALAALSWTICWIIIVLPFTPRRYKEWAFEHRISILEATFWFGTFNAIVSIILWVVNLGG